jgi:hypothetical protein
VAIRPEEPAKVASLELDENVSARIADDLASGQIVVVQAGLQSEGWWRIDPATGDALGMGPTGKGSVLAEYALVLIVQGIINAVQCKLAGAATAFIEKNIAELDKAAAQRDSSAGVKAAVAQGQESWKKNSNTHCFAVGIMGAFDAGLLFASFELAKRVSGSGRAPGLASTGGEPAKGTPGERPAPGEQAAKGEENRSPSPENSPPEQGEGEQPGAQNESPSRSEGPEQPSPEGQSNEQASNAAGEGEPNAQRANDADAANPTAEGGNPHVRRNDWKSAEDANNAVDQAMDKALEAKARNEANPTNENQAALDQALKDLRNLENDRANWMFENGQVPAARPPRPGASGPDSPPPTEMPPTEMPPTEMPPTEMPPTEMPPTEMPPTEMPPTEMPATEMPATQAASGAQPSPSQPPSMSPSAESVPTPQNIPPPTQRSPGVADPSPMANSVPPPAPGIQGQPVLSPSAGNQTLPGVGIPGASGAQSGNTITGVQEVKPVQVGAGNAAGLNPFAVTQRIPGQAPPATTTMTGLPPPPPTTTLAGANGLAGAFEGIAGNPTAEGTPEPP